MTATSDRVGELRSGGIDARALTRWAATSLPGFAGPLTVGQFQGGASNPTLLLTGEGTGARYVLRTQPPGPLLAGAHRVDREYRVMRALADTPVPVPEMLAWCDDAAVIGRPFYVMPFLDGRIFADNHFAGLSRAERVAAYDDAADTLAAIHAVDLDAVGLADFGQGAGYYERQLARWTRRYCDTATETIPAMDRVMGRLAARVPEQRRVTLVHGDYRQENLLFAPDAPRIRAVLDWEMATLGDPIADLAFFCLFYHADFKPWGSAATIDFATTGVPTEAAFVARYCAAAGIADVGDWRFHLGFAAFRLAAIAQGVHARTLAGTSDTGRYRGNGAPDWAALAERLLAGLNSNNGEKLWANS